MLKGRDVVDAGNNDEESDDPRRATEHQQAE